MEYIKAEEFLIQPVEIQKSFLDWWDWETFDLFSDKNVRGSKYSLRYVINDNLFISLDDKEVYTYSVIPLLTEGQLRQFIEDKTGFLMSCRFEEYDCSFINDTYYIVLYNRKMHNVEHTYEIETTDLLQAYWKVAIEIAKEEIK